MKIKFLLKVKDFLHEHSPTSYSLILAVPIILLVLGYLIWVTYLQALGVTEIEILRGKYILTGAVFVTCSAFAWIILDIVGLLIAKLWKRFKWPHAKGEIWNNVRDAGIGTLALVWFLVYVFYLFPIIPLGGNQPRSLSLVAPQESMKILNSFGIQIATGASYQTESVCIFNENSQSIYIFRTDRILIIDRDLVDGYGSLPGVIAYENKKYCSVLAAAWLHQAFENELALFNAATVNAVLRFFHLQPIFYTGAPDISGQCVPTAL